MDSSAISFILTRIIDEISSGKKVPGYLPASSGKLPGFPAWTVGGNSREGFPAWTVEPHNKLISGGGFAYGLFEARATTLPRD